MDLRHGAPMHDIVEMSFSRLSAEDYSGTARSPPSSSPGYFHGASAGSSPRSYATGDLSYTHSSSHSPLSMLGKAHAIPDQALGAGGQVAPPLLPSLSLQPPSGGLSLPSARPCTSRSSSTIGSSRGHSPPALPPSTLTFTPDTDPFQAAALLASALAQSSHQAHSGSPRTSTLTHALLHVLVNDTPGPSTSPPSELTVELLMAAARHLLQASALASQDLSTNHHNHQDLVLIPFASPASSPGAAGGCAISVLALATNLPAAVCLSPGSMQILVSPEGSPQMKAHEIGAVVSSGLQADVFYDPRDSLLLLQTVLLSRLSLQGSGTDILLLPAALGQVKAIPAAHVLSAKQLQQVTSLLQRQQDGQVIGLGQAQKGLVDPSVVGLLGLEQLLAAVGGATAPAAPSVPPASSGARPPSSGGSSDSSVPSASAAQFAPRQFSASLLGLGQGQGDQAPSADRPLQGHTSHTSHTSSQAASFAPAALPSRGSHPDLQSQTSAMAAAAAAEAAHHQAVTAAVTQAQELLQQPGGAVAAATAAAVAALFPLASATGQGQGALGPQDPSTPAPGAGAAGADGQCMGPLGTRSLSGNVGGVGGVGGNGLAHQGVGAPSKQGLLPPPPPPHQPNHPQQHNGGSGSVSRSLSLPPPSNSHSHSSQAPGSLTPAPGPGPAPPQSSAQRARKADYVIVTEDTAIKNAAGAIAKVLCRVCDQGFCCPVYTERKTGQPTGVISVAVKAITVARGYVDNEGQRYQVAFQPYARLVSGHPGSAGTGPGSASGGPGGGYGGQGCDGSVGGRPFLIRSADNSAANGAEGSSPPNGGLGLGSGGGSGADGESGADIAFDVFKVPPGLLPNVSQDSNLPVKVTAHSRAHVVSNIVAKLILDHGSAVLITAGGPAMRVAMRAVVAARGRLALGRSSMGPVDILLVPQFVTVDTKTTHGWESVFLRFHIIRVPSSMLGSPEQAATHTLSALGQVPGSMSGSAPGDAATAAALAASIPRHLLYQQLGQGSGAATVGSVTGPLGQRGGHHALGGQAVGGDNVYLNLNGGGQGQLHAAYHMQQHMVNQAGAMAAAAAAAVAATASHQAQPSWTSLHNHQQQQQQMQQQQQQASAAALARGAALFARTSEPLPGHAPFGSLGGGAYPQMGFARQSVPVGLGLGNVQWPLGSSGNLLTGGMDPQGQAQGQGLMWPQPGGGHAGGGMGW